MTTPSNDADDHDQLSLFESSAHDQTIASWLAQYTYTNNNRHAATANDRHPPSALISTFCLGPVRESLGMTIPIIWMANLACNFQSEFTNSEDLDDNNNDQEILSTPRTYRQFTMEEQKRFDTLQLSYLTEKIEHSIDLEYCGTRQFHLSPRMIISSKAERNNMIEVLRRYLDVKTKGDKREKIEFTKRVIIVDSSSDANREVMNGMGKKKTKRENRRRKLKRQQAKERELSSLILSDNNNINDLNVSEQSNDNDQDDDDVETNWCCDYCGVAMFSTYEDACQHEKGCSAYLKLMDKDSQDDGSKMPPAAIVPTIQMANQEKVLCESSNGIISSANLALMRSATIDYDDRVNDTALPLPNQDAEANSLPMSMDKIDKLSSSPVQPILIYNVQAAKTADEVSLLQRVTNLTLENELLIVQNNLLINQNRALTEKLVETKRQSIEAVQQVHLKAYIAETARIAADERATQMVGIVGGLVTDMVTDEVLRQEMICALERSASNQITPPRQSGMPPQSFNKMYPSPTSKQALYTDSTTNVDIEESILFRLRRGDNTREEFF